MNLIAYLKKQEKKLNKEIDLLVEKGNTEKINTLLEQINTISEIKTENKIY